MSRLLYRLSYRPLLEPIVAVASSLQPGLSISLFASLGPSLRSVMACGQPCSPADHPEARLFRGGQDVLLVGGSQVTVLSCHNSNGSNEMFERDRKATDGMGRPPSVTTGTIAELRVATDLLAKGFDVYRSYSPAARCDLVAIKDDRILTIEVRSGRRTATGKLQYCSPVGTRQYTTFALVLPAEIRYTGTLVPEPTYEPKAPDILP